MTMKKFGMLEWLWLGYAGVLFLIHLALGITNHLGWIAVLAVVGVPAHVLAPYLHISMLFPSLSGWPSLALNWLWFSFISGGTYYLLARIAVWIISKKRNASNARPEQSQ